MEAVEIYWVGDSWGDSETPAEKRATIWANGDLVGRYSQWILERLDHRYGRPILEDFERHWKMVRHYVEISSNNGYVATARVNLPPPAAPDLSIPDIAKVKLLGTWTFSEISPTDGVLRLYSDGRLEGDQFLIEMFEDIFEIEMLGVDPEQVCSKSPERRQEYMQWFDALLREREARRG